MKQVSVTYKAPPGDSKVTEAFGHTFYHGKPEEILVDDHTLEKLRGNRHFTCGEASDADPEEDPAADERLAAEDKAKRVAQGTPPPSRGAVLPKEPDEPDEPHGDHGEAGNPSHSFPLKSNG